jgi:hypothetical protein
MGIESLGSNPPGRVLSEAGTFPAGDEAGDDYGLRLWLESDCSSVGNFPVLCQRLGTLSPTWAREQRTPASRCGINKPIRFEPDFMRTRLGGGQGDRLRQTRTNKRREGSNRTRINCTETRSTTVGEVDRMRMSTTALQGRVSLRRTWDERDELAEP